MDYNIRAQITKYEVDASNQDEIIQLLETFQGWVLSETLEGNDILITDKRRGRNHLTIVSPGSYVVSFNNGSSGYVFRKSEQLYQAFGLQIDL